MIWPNTRACRIWLNSSNWANPDMFDKYLVVTEIGELARRYAC